MTNSRRGWSAIRGKARNGSTMNSRPSTALNDRALDPWSRSLMVQTLPRIGREALWASYCTGAPENHESKRLDSSQSTKCWDLKLSHPTHSPHGRSRILLAALALFRSLDYRKHSGKDYRAPLRPSLLYSFEGWRLKQAESELSCRRAQWGHKSSLNRIR